ncbi:MAG: M67 family metallopeptidase [Gammaproteobacteria bacterium]|nr:M67 family metallopeptidase [Gammaproteobacteria bacterium]
MSASVLALPRCTVNRLLEVAQAHPGVEVCGFVVRAGDSCAVRSVSNVAGDPARRFEMDPAGMIDAFRHEREDGEEIVAIYHSHPSGPSLPSALDRELAYYPELPYLVISLGTRGVLELRAFRLGDGECEEMPLVLEETLD